MFIYFEGRTGIFVEQIRFWIFLPFDVAIKQGNACANRGWLM